jgi:hypothetical protein
MRHPKNKKRLHFHEKILLVFLIGLIYRIAAALDAIMSRKFLMGEIMMELSKRLVGRFVRTTTLTTVLLGSVICDPSYAGKPNHAHPIRLRSHQHVEMQQQFAERNNTVKTAAAILKRVAFNFFHDKYEPWILTEFCPEGAQIYFAMKRKGIAPWWGPQQDPSHRNIYDGIENVLRNCSCTDNTEGVRKVLAQYWEATQGEVQPYLAWLWGSDIDPEIIVIRATEKAAEIFEINRVLKRVLKIRSGESLAETEQAEAARQAFSAIAHEIAAADESSDDETTTPDASPEWLHREAERAAQRSQDRTVARAWARARTQEIAERPRAETARHNLYFWDN